MIEFSIKPSKNVKQNLDFEESFLSLLSFNLSQNRPTHPPQVLEVMDSFIEGQPQTLLTYYINESNKTRALSDQERLQFLKKNILQNKRAIEGNDNFTRSIEKSFNELINSL